MDGLEIEEFKKKPMNGSISSTMNHPRHSKISADQYLSSSLDPQTEMMLVI